MRGQSAFLDVRQVAARLGVGESRAYQLCARGQVPVVRRGRRVLIPTLAFERWLARLNDEALASTTSQEAPRAS